MGVGSSKEEEARLTAAVDKLSKVELKYIEEVFGELSYPSEDGKRLIKRPTWLNRENFASKFGLPDFLGEQLFDAFDRDQNEVVDLDEFLVGMALCLHGSIKDKCQLLFKMFNLNQDEGITKEELSTGLISALQSTQGVLKKFISTDEEKGTVGWDMTINETVDRIVRDAFKKCDTSRNGKLELNEFEHWLHKNPKLFDSGFLVSCPRPSEDDPSNYDVIATPISTDPNPPEFPKQTEESDESSTSRLELFGSQATTTTDPKTSSENPANRLSDLFGSGVTQATDPDGQHFFDSLGSQNAPTADTNIASPKLVSDTKGMDFPAPQVVTAPNITDLTKDIISHNLGHLTEERLATRGSEMSLVSLGQSTGDLSVIENEADIMTGQGYEASQANFHSLGQSAIDNEAGNVIGNEDPLASVEKAKCAEDVTGPVAEPLEEDSAAVSWHPLKEPKAATVELLGNTGEELFPDAPGVIDIGVNDGNNAGLLNEDVEVKISLDDGDDGRISDGNESAIADSMVQIDVQNTTLPSKPAASAVDLPSSIENKIIDSTLGSFISTEETIVPDTDQSPDDQSPEFKQILVSETTEVTERPKTLHVPAEDGLLSVDLCPSDNAIGKPTLRQLAEMKEFDTSPSLEDSKSILPEARFAAWQPSPETKLLIDAVKRGNVIDKTNLTYPSVLLDTSMGDPVKDLVVKFLGEQEAMKRPVPTADSVTMNDAGLRDLLEAQCWRGAVDWTAKYLTAHGQGLSSGSPTGPFNHTPKLLQIWFVRIALLYKLKSFSSAEAELNAFGNFDNPDLYYDYYPHLYQGMKGCLVPFSLRVIHAELPQHNGRPQETLNRLYRLLHTVESVMNNLKNGLSEQGEDVPISEEDVAGSIELWDTRNTRILYAIGNCLLGNKEYNLALKIFSEIIKKNPETKPAIISGVGRLHLQLGDINLAKKYFRRVEQISLGDPKTLSVTVMNRGFVALAEGKYDEAFENFQSVTKLNPENSSAWNNSAVCLLFQGKVKEASSLLETLIWKSPKKNLHEDIIFNLCTIYELETSRALQKKQKLLDLVCRHKGDGFNIQSLKLT